MTEPLMIESVVTRHFDEAATIWPMRDADVHGTARTLDDLLEQDARVDAHLDGLRIATEQGWNESSIEADFSDPGEAFVRTLLAIEGGNREALEQPLEATAADQAAARGVVSAFGWVSSPLLRGMVTDLLSSSHASARLAGIAACAVRRVDPGDALRLAILDDDGALRRRALRAVGELGRADLSGLVRTHYQDDDVGCRFWAAWSAVLTGDRGEGLKVLSALASVDSAWRGRAMQPLLRVLSPSGARDWLRGLRDRGDAQRDLLIGVAIAGDASFAPWLLDQMEIPEWARLAGEAFSTITGLDLYNEQLTTDRPEAFESGPTDDPDDDDVAMDPDTDLEWPHAQLLREWWDANGVRFANGRRLLAGADVTPDHCRRLLREGRQGLRRAAAFELALMEPAAPLFEIRARASRQQRTLNQ